MEAGFAEVEFVLEAAEDFVADAAVIAEADGRLALDAEQFVGQVAVPVVVGGAGTVFVAAVTAQHGELLAVVMGQVVVD